MGRRAAYRRQPATAGADGTVVGGEAEASGTEGRARMGIEWNLPPRPGPQKGGGAPSKDRIWRLSLWAFFDETVRKEGTEPTPALIPHQLPQALQVSKPSDFTRAWPGGGGARRG